MKQLLLTALLAVSLCSAKKIHAQAGLLVANDGGCVTLTFRENGGDDMFTNGCGHNAKVVVFFSGNGGYLLEIEDGKVGTSRHPKSFYDSHVGAKFFACPAKTKAVDPDGKAVTIQSSDKDYKCRQDLYK